MSERHELNLEARFRAEDQLYSSILHRPEDNKIMFWGLMLAILLHIVVLFVNFPDMRTVLPKEEKKVIVVRKYVPPPPPVQSRPAGRRAALRTPAARVQARRSARA